MPGDISSAVFLIVAALITPGSDITLHNIGINPTRDGIIEIVERMGGNISLSNQTDGPEPTATIRVQYTPDLKASKSVVVSFQNVLMSCRQLRYSVHKRMVQVS